MSKIDMGSAAYRNDTPPDMEKLLTSKVVPELNARLEAEDCLP